MTGWVALILLIAAAFIVLRLAGVRQGLLTAALAALMLGASGYALQGHPGLAAAPAKSSEDREIQSLTEARHAFFGNFSAEESWLRISEALASHGNTEDAVNVLQNAVRRYPGDAQLWVGLGNALVEHGQGITPPAEFAYRRSMELLPGHPAPRFFYDFAALRSGAGDPALQDLIALLKQYPNASWRPLVAKMVLGVTTNDERPPAQAAR